MWYGKNKCDNNISTIFWKSHDISITIYRRYDTLRAVLDPGLVDLGWWLVDLRQPECSSLASSSAPAPSLIRLGMIAPSQTIMKMGTCSHLILVMAATSRPNRSMILLKAIMTPRQIMHFTCLHQSDVPSYVGIFFYKKITSGLYPLPPFPSWAVVPQFSCEGLI